MDNQKNSVNVLSKHYTERLGKKNTARLRHGPGKEHATKPLGKNDVAKRTLYDYVFHLVRVVEALSYQVERSKKKCQQTADIAGVHGLVGRLLNEK